MRRCRSISRVAALSAVLLLAGATPSFAQWYRDYESGVKALSGGDFQTAVQLLESARREGPSPGDRVRYFGMRYDSFYPHYYLGKAYQGLGNAEKAREMLELSSQAGELQKDASLAADRKSALEQLARPVVADVPAKGPDLGPQLDPIRTLLGRGAVNEARGKLDALEQAHPKEVDERFRALSAEIQKSVAAAEQKLAQAAEFVDSGDFARARPLIQDARGIDVTRSGAEALLSRLETAQKTAEVQRSVESIETMLGAGRISDAEQELNKAKRLDAKYPGLDALTVYLEDVRRASRAYSRKEFAEAEPLLVDLTKNHPDNRWARRVHDEIKNKLQASTRTDDVVTPPIEDVPVDPPVDDIPVEDPAQGILAQARELLGQKRLKDALETLEQSNLPLDTPERVSLEDEVRRAAFEKARDGVRRIFRGEREDAILELEDARMALRDRAMFHLYLALAYHRAYLYQGQDDEDLLNKMELSIQNALELDRNVEPDPQLFSPVIRSAISRLRERS